MKLVSIDPGIERTGYAVFFRGTQSPQLLEWGCITTSRQDEQSLRLEKIYLKIKSTLDTHKPEQLVIEDLFFNTNQKTGISVARSQGVLMIAAARAKVPVHFLAPLAIKQALTGYGRADKRQVQKMVKLLLSLDSIPKPDDAADAIACGLAFCQTNRFEDVL